MTPQCSLQHYNSRTYVAADNRTYVGLRTACELDQDGSFLIPLIVSSEAQVKI